MDIKMLDKMTVRELQYFLRCRGMKVTGRKGELICRAFVAAENNVKVVKTATEVEEELQDEYASKLLLDKEILPDPMSLSNWLSEDESLALWPMITYGNIYNFLMFQPSELGGDDLNDYKTSKAYSYFKNGWLGQISYHSISETSKNCFLKANCRPSQRINDPDHKLWVCVSKSETNRIIAAHCSCMAGMSETCNHVAALLFRVEAAVSCGLTNPSCTTKSCEWLPNRQEVAPQKMKALCYNRDEMDKNKKSKRPLVSSPKKRYNPLINCKQKPLTLHDFAAALENVIPLSILQSAVPKPKIDFVRELINTKPLYKNYTSVRQVIESVGDKETFYAELNSTITSESILKIQQLTEGQSSNEAWYHFRLDVVTASKCHEILTKIKKLNNGKAVNLWATHQKVAGLVFVNPDLPALRYGREMETVALQKFKEVFTLSHKKVCIDTCGLFLDESVKFVGASPDGIVSCDCCPKAILEIKCPYSTNHLSPEKADIDFLVSSGEIKKLKKSHKYFTQCQLQMHVTGFVKCYFFVWTMHGFVMDEIAYDKEFCDLLLSNICIYYDNFLDFKFGTQSK